MIILSILSGLLLGLSFVFPSLGFIAWLAFIPLVSFLRKEKSLKKNFWAGFLTGLVFLSLVFSWLFQVLPLNWLGVENSILGFFLLFLVWFLGALVLPSLIGVFFLSYQFFSKKDWLDILLIPFLWIIFEYLRGLVFSLIFSGSQSVIGGHWTFGHLGYLLADNASLRVLASFGGIYFLSFLLVFFNVVLFILFKRKKLLFLFLFLILIFSNFFVPFKSNEKGESLKIALITTNFSPSFHISQEEREMRMETEKSLVKESSEADIIVFPEDSRFLKFVSSSWLKDEFFQKETLIIDSSRLETEEGLKSIITFWNSQKDIVGFQEKLFLVPFGEYLPYLTEFLAGVFDKNWLREYRVSRSYNKGEKLNSVNFKGVNIGALLCSEILSPYFYGKLGESSNILFNMGNHDFSHGSLILDNQIKSISRIRAIETGKCLVKTANRGSSYIIDPRGRIIKETGIGNKVVLAEVYPKEKKTFYNNYGNFTLFLALFFLTLRKYLL